MCVCVGLVIWHALLALTHPSTPPPSTPAPNQPTNQPIDQPFIHLSIHLSTHHHSAPRWTAKSAMGLVSKMAAQGSDYGAASAEVYVDGRAYEVQVSSCGWWWV